MRYIEMASMRIFWFVLAALFFWAYASAANAAPIDVTLQWNSSPTADGYYIYHGKETGVYGAPIKVLDNGQPIYQHTLQLDQLNDDYDEYFALTAYNDYGESDFSNEVKGAIIGLHLPPPLVGYTKMTSIYPSGLQVENDILGQKITTTYPDGKIVVIDFVAGTVTTYPADGGDPIITQLP